MAIGPHFGHWCSVCLIAIPLSVLGASQRGEQISGGMLSEARDIIHRLLPALSLMQRVVEGYPEVLLHSQEELETGVAELKRMYPGANDRDLAVIAVGDPERIFRPYLRSGLL